MQSKIIFGFALVALGTAQWDPTSWDDTNPVPQQTVDIHISGTQTDWVGPTDYLTTVVETVTVSGTPVATTQSLEYAVATVTAAAPGENVGDLSILITPKLKNAWTDAAVQACGAKKRDTKRAVDFNVCAPKYLRGALQNVAEALFGDQQLPSVVVADIEALVAAGVADGSVLATQTGLAALALVALRQWMTETTMPEAIKIPKEDIQPATTSNPACKPLQTNKPNDVICEDINNCNGQSNVCRQGKYKGCPCANAMVVVPYEGWQDYNQQNSILAAWQIASDAADLATKPKCTPTNQGMDPAVLNQLAVAFCEKADYSKPYSAFMGGSDLTPPAKIDGNMVGWFNFIKSGTSDLCDVSQCQAAYQAITKTCQFSSHSFNGGGSEMVSCGIFTVNVINAPPTNACSGGFAGDLECTTGGEKFAITSNPWAMPSIYIRPASTAADDGLRLLRNFDSQLQWLSSIGSSAQWGSSSRSDQEDTRAKYRGKVESSERGWNDPWSRDWIRAYIAEVEIKREDLSSELLELAIESTNDTVRLPVAGMILQGQSSEYVRGVIPENDDNDPFIYLLYLLSDRRTARHGKGAGVALISHAKDEARTLGIKRLCVDCWRGNDDKLVHYYEQQGFRVIGNFEAEDKDKWPGAVLEMRL